MGSYAELDIMGYSIHSTKSVVDNEVMTIFREADKRTIPNHSPNDNVFGDAVDFVDGEEIDCRIVYTCEVWKVRDRLNIMGFTLSRVKHEFHELLSSHLESIKLWESDPDFDGIYAEEISFLEMLTFESYLEGSKELIELGIQPWDSEALKGQKLSSNAQYIFGDHEPHHLGFFNADVRSLIRALCEVVPGTAWVTQDVTELVGGGYFEPDFKFAEYASFALVARHPENAKRIILTEGKTDCRILIGAMSVLYPHLLEYYSFFDFEETKSEGGVGRLVALVKGFVASGVSNRVIALFDNDSAAKEAINSLSKVNVPENIAIMTYPEMDELQSYPTIGPNGQACLNVNGLAASIELYLGNDVLVDEKHGGLTPVQWKGYNDALRQYQGEVLHKGILQEKFDQKLAAAKSSPDSIKLQDWSGLDAILQAVFNAFESKNLP